MERQISPARNRHDARMMLSRMRLYEPVARDAENSPNAGWRAQAQDVYRRAIGVDVAKRFEAKGQLEEVAQTGRRSVAELLSDPSALNLRASDRPAPKRATQAQPIGSESRDPPGIYEEVRQRLRNAFDARRLLARMDVQEALVRRYDELAPDGDLETVFWKQRYAALYGGAVGVAPEQRGDLRTALERVAQNGARSVEGVIERVNLQANSVESPTRAPSAPGAAVV